MTAKRYVVGIIKNGKGKPVGVAMFNVFTKSIEIRAIKNLEAQILAGEDIKGLSKKCRVAYYGSSMDYKTIDYVQVTHSKYYNTSKLPLIDSEGNVIKPGANVCIGSIGTDALKKFIIVNTKGEINFLPENEIRQEIPVGIINYGNRLVLSNECKNVYMTEEEFYSMTSEKDLQKRY